MKFSVSTPNLHSFCIFYCLRSIYICDMCAQDSTRAKKPFTHVWAVYSLHKFHFEQIRCDVSLFWCIFKHETWRIQHRIQRGYDWARLFSVDWLNQFGCRLICYTQQYWKHPINAVLFTEIRDIWKQTHEWNVLKIIWAIKILNNA